MTRVEFLCFCCRHCQAEHDRDIPVDDGQIRRDAGLGVLGWYNKCQTFNQTTCWGSHRVKMTNAKGIMTIEKYPIQLLPLICVCFCFISDISRVSKSYTPKYTINTNPWTSLCQRLPESLRRPCLRAAVFRLMKCEGNVGDSCVRDSTTKKAFALHNALQSLDTSTEY